MTTPETPGPESPATGGELRLNVDIDRTGDANRFAFRSAPAEGDSSAWRASGDVVRGNQGLKITRLEVTCPDEHPSGITGGLMRQIPLGTLLDYVRGAIALHDIPRVTQIEAPVVPSGGRTVMSDALLRAVASAYLRETAPGRPSGAVRRIAEEFERPEETIRTWVGRARKAGWLGPSVKGRSGAEPGPKFFEHAMFERVDGSERVLAPAGTEGYRKMSESEDWVRWPDEKTAEYKQGIQERHEALTDEKQAPA
ncbi:hypothetical protein KPP03845_102735 [Streptomyces xanthophaeus]|uniref:hypothetical protein n=1 Tax=Streptomyces xanthophaeus TaxID=67385 RepID=UPI00233E6A16|nr:hypothetical protein [Streptomyces xanthophaeus]WCD86389.1 hypothetical protein KPP03845_102735 [Streptomyces xanthophaeus]